MSEQNSNTKLFSILSYITILWLVGLLAAPEDKTVKFHVNQGLILFILEIAVNIVGAILGFIPVIGWILSIIIYLANILFLVLAILGIINAANGAEKELPFIGSFRILK